MKQAVIALSLLSSLFLFSHEHQEQKKALRIYLCSRLTQNARAWNDLICEELYFDDEIDLFRPQDVDLSHLTAFEKDYAAYYADLEGIQHSDLLLVLPPYGRDCAWEIGWFCGAKKVTLAYIESVEEWLRDAMVMGGISAIITNNENSYQLLLENPLTSYKSYLIDSRQSLAQKIKELYHNHGQTKN